MYKQEYFNHLLHNSYINTFNSFSIFLSFSLSSLSFFPFSQPPYLSLFFYSRCCSGKEPSCQGRRHRRPELDLLVRKIPWRRARQPTPVFLPGESHGQRSLVGQTPQGCTQLDMTEATQHSISISISFNISHPSCSLSHIHGFSLGKCMCDLTRFQNKIDEEILTDS